MATSLTIVGLGGSVAQISRSRAALQVALEGAASAGATTELLDLRELELPMHNPDDDGPSPAAARLIESCYAADGMLWSSPMYQGTIAPSRTRSKRSYCWTVSGSASLSWEREVTPSFGKIRYRCDSTVRCERYSLCPISRLLSPVAAISAI
jgi:NADPH-dependent FMN reductase